MGQRSASCNQTFYLTADAGKGLVSLAVPLGSGNIIQYFNLSLALEMALIFSLALFLWS